jgi:uncharacterized protein YceH (UPF0502 family)
LGALLEKDITTPEYYPMTVNALLNACNQKSNRDPVVAYDEATVHEALASLQHRGLVTHVSGAGHRVEKYGHRMGDRLNLGRRETALLCVLMLRGPQTPGELRGRTERMYQFSDLDEVEHVLTTLATRTPPSEGAWGPLVVKLAVQPGMKEARWAHLLSGEPDLTALTSNAAAAPMPGGLEDRVSKLEAEVAELRQQIEQFRRQFE